MKLTKKLTENPIVLPVYAPSWLLAFSRGMLIPILPLYVREFGASYSLIGVVIATQELGTPLADLPAGAMLRQLGGKHAMLLVLASLTIATSLLFWVGNLGQAIMLCFWAGCGLALYNVALALHQYLAEMVEQGNWGRVIAGLGGVNRFGLLVGPAALSTKPIDMTLFYPAGWLVDNYGRKFAIVPCILIQATGMVLLLLTHTFPGLLAATCLIGFGNGIGSGTMMTLGADLAPPTEWGEFLGAWNLIGDGGVTLSTVIVGGVANLAVLPAAALVLAVCGAAAGFIFARLAPETLKDGRR